jgi:predicted amidophosphoribosyltransferase
VHRTVAVPGYSPVGVDASVVAGPEMLRIITAFKDSGRSDLAPLLGRLMNAHRPHQELARADIVVAVPQSRHAYRRRGWDPLDTLARSAGYSLTRVLEVQARHADQTTLTRDARWHNVSQTMRVTPPAREMIRGRSVIVVDDVITTGATLSEAARALWNDGARDVRGVTLASVARATSNSQVKR